LRIQLYRTRDNAIEGAAISFLDITELRKALVKITDMQRVEDELRQSEERFKRLFVEAPLGIALIDSITGRFCEINPKFAKITGRSEADILGRDWMSITHPDDVRQDLEQMALLNAGTIPGFQMEKRYLQPDGSAIWIHMTIAPVMVQDSNQLRHLCMIEDITGHKQTEARLRAVEERYALALAAVNDGIWDWHVPSGKAIFSTRYYAILGYEDQEFPATYDSWRLLVHPADLDRVEEELRQSLTSGQGFAIDLRMRTKTGQWLWVCTRGKTIESDNESKALRLLGTLHDITKRRQEEEILALAGVNARLSVVVRDAHDAITVQDLTGEILAWNPGAVRIYGWSEAEALAMNVCERIPPDLREGALDTLAQLSRAEIIEPYTTRRLTRDGRSIQISIVSSALLNAAGEMYAIATTERETPKK
jgi:PAS domain S-box-containing protein